MVEPIVRSAHAQEWLDSYHRDLDCVRGLALATRHKYVHVVGELLKTLSRDGIVDSSSFTAEAICEFVRSDAARRTRTGKRQSIAPVRSFLRFLISKEVLSPGLDRVIPMMKAGSRAALQQPLNKSELEQVLNVARKNSHHHAVFLLLSRLGLRAHEIAGLQLSDIDWASGSMLIRARKTRCERTLPLPKDVGEVLLQYLRNGRPTTIHQEVFIQPQSPVPMKPSGIAKLSTRLLARAGVRRRVTYGAHLFRHTAATQMINSGATFKDIADLLGHQSLQTTAIYAKFDLQTLSKIAMPWPAGGEQ
jgi:site-specific recombinase XerD